jgi:hypothetical protein
VQFNSIETHRSVINVSTVLTDPFSLPVLGRLGVVDRCRLFLAKHLKRCGGRRSNRKRCLKAGHLLRQRQAQQKTKGDDRFDHGRASLTVECRRSKRSAGRLLFNDATQRQRNDGTKRQSQEKPIGFQLGSQFPVSAGMIYRFRSIVTATL